MKRLITFTPFLMIFACGGSPKETGEINDQIKTQLNSNQIEPVNLALVGPSTWERVCILTPYTDNTRAEKILGFSWNSEAHTSIISSDGINVLVFVQGNRVIAYTEHPRNSGDFSKLEPQCLARSQATLVRQLAHQPHGDDWVYLITSQQKTKGDVQFKAQ